MASSSATMSRSAFLGSKVGAPAFSSINLLSSSGDMRAAQRSRGVVAMAKTKSGRVLIRMVSSAGTGVFYVTSKNPRNTANKLELLKFDPVAKKRVLFQEAKIKSGSK